MKKRIVSIIFLFGFISAYLSAQVAMGKWRTHFAYNSVAQIAQSTTKIYAVSDGALFSVDKEDGQNGMEFYSKVSGLNGSDISRIEFDQTSQSLLIVYSDGNIDLLTSGGVVNVPDLLDKQMSASKAVNDIQFYQGKAFLSCNFGIIVLNMQKREVADTYYIGPNASDVKVLNTTVYDNQIYALSASTIFKASANESQLVNYEFWSTVSGLPGSGSFQRIESFAGQLILLRGGKLYKQESANNWIPFLTDITATDFNVTNESLNVFDGSSFYLVDNQFNVKTVSNIGTLTDTEFDSSTNTYWFAGNALGVISYKLGSNGVPTLNYYKPNGPAVNVPYNMVFSNKKLFVVTGRPKTGEFLEGKVMMYKDGVWTNIYGQSEIGSQINNNVDNFMHTAVDPTDENHFFIPSFGNGVFEFKDNQFYKWHNHTNSTLECNINALNNPWKYTRLDGGVYDNKGNVFFSNSTVSDKIQVLLNTGKWVGLRYANLPDYDLGQILIDKLNPNYKWVTTSGYGTISVFDDNGTIEDQSDDRFVTFKNFPDPDNTGGNITHNKEFCLAQDKNGVIWLGTDLGPLLFNNTSKVFDSGYTCSRVKIPRNDSTNLADYLLVNERIKSIAIDGANRKWLGTESSGVYLMSENGQQTIKHFTVSNSPLLSNDILSIAIHPTTGEVFFGTGSGIVSYQSDASEAGNTFGDVYAYPNPVREGFTGVITITGLVENTQVKITDINGNLVCQTVSNGSIATWDGKDVHGRKVSTGIYLAMCVNADGTQNAIAKILFIN